MPPFGKLKQTGFKTQKHEPPWKGPASKDAQGGITFSLLSRYLQCKERFRLYAVEGLTPSEGFNHRIEYGSMWHVCEESYAKVQDNTWRQSLKTYTAKLCKQYRQEQEKVLHWSRVCELQFPEYVSFWQNHPDMENRTPLLQEVPFQIPYALPSGRTVYLRGKLDSADFISGAEDKTDNGIWLQENKTKGDIDELQMGRQLTFDLQTMIYLVALSLGLCPTCQGRWTKAKADALDESESMCPNCGGEYLKPYTTADKWQWPKGFPGDKIVGVRYNVIRRPLSGGKGTIKQKQTENKEDFYERLRCEYLAAEPEAYFMRWNVKVSPAQIATFRRTCLDPILENCLDDYEWWSWCSYEGRQFNLKQSTVTVEGRNLWDYQQRKDRFTHHQARHYRHPFGVRNFLDEGRASEYDNYLATGSTTGLSRVENMFPELQEVITD